MRAGLIRRQLLSAATRHRNRSLILAAVLVLVGLTLLAGAGPASAAGSLRVNPGAGRVGEAVRVDVADWPIGIVEVSLCGNAGARGSQDCAVSMARTITVAPPSPTSKRLTGKGFTLLTLSRPPVPCPCLVRAVHREAGLLATAAVKIRGLRTTPGATGGTEQGTTAAAEPGTSKPVAPVRKLTVESISVQDEAGLWSGATWASWAGIRTERVLQLTVRNTGNVAVRDPAWSLSAGRPGAASAVVPVPALGVLKPGGRRTVRVPVALAGPVVGRYTVTGSIDGLDSPVPVGAELSSWPWAVPAAVALLATALLALPAIQARRARRRRSTSDSASSSPAPIDTPMKVRS